MGVPILDTKTHRWIAGAVVALGVALLGYMVVVESEPGAVPLLLIAVGVGWYVAMGRRKPR